MNEGYWSSVTMTLYDLEKQSGAQEMLIVAEEDVSIPKVKFSPFFSFIKRMHFLKMVMLRF